MTMTISAQELLAVQLHTERLILRPLRRDDTAFVVRHFTDPAVHRFLLDNEPITDADEAAAIVDFYLADHEPTFNRWVLVRRDDGEPIGTCGYHRWSHRHHKAEIGYDLSPAAQGHGYMTEALTAVLAHGSGAMRLHRIEALVAVANSPSARLLERLGFQREGVLRDSFFSDGRFHDHLLFARLSSLS
jgi:[ribosomal protein S5]-alanine N-acetyltransferase